MKNDLFPGLPPSRRLIICIKDVEKIFSIKDRAARIRLQKTRHALQKQRHQAISISEFCKYWGIDEENVYTIINP